MEGFDFVNVSESNDDSIIASWKGASIFAELAMNNVDAHSKYFVSRCEYEEHGHYYCNNKFQLYW